MQTQRRTVNTLPGLCTEVAKTVEQPDERIAQEVRGGCVPGSDFATGTVEGKCRTFWRHANPGEGDARFAVPNPGEDVL